MDENEIFNKINELLGESDYPLEIKDISDIEDFLNNDENKRFDEYDTIAAYYDSLITGYEPDEYPEDI